MNNNRRKQLQAIREELQDIYERLDILCDEEWAAYDNLPEPFQDSERGEKMQSAISTLESVRDQVWEAADEIGEIWFPANAEVLSGAMPARDQEQRSDGIFRKYDSSNDARADTVGRWRSGNES